MDYLPFIPDYQNFIIPASIALVITVIVTYYVCHRLDSSYTETSGINTFWALFAGSVGAYIVGMLFSYVPNTAENENRAQHNLEVKYDVTASNVTPAEGSKDITYTTDIVANQDKQAYSVWVLFNEDGTPTIINDNVLDASTIER